MGHISPTGPQRSEISRHGPRKPVGHHRLSLRTVRQYKLCGHDELVYNNYIVSTTFRLQVMFQSWEAMHIV
jgi:hypothetical protein